MRQADFKAIAAAVVQSACESPPADHEHPDTILISTEDLETIVRVAVENHVEAMPALVCAEPAEMSAQALIEYVAQVSASVGFQAGVGGCETAGAIMSYLAANPDKLGKFVEEGFVSLVDDPRDYHLQGRLTWLGADGRIWSPEQARAAVERKRGQLQ